jgi:hypothetical protein
VAPTSFHWGSAEGARALIALKENLTESGIALAFARVPWDLLSEFDRHHLTESIGPVRIFNRLHDAIAAFEGAEEKASGTVSDSRMQGTLADLWSRRSENQ